MAERKRALLQGNEAVVEGAIAAGMRFFAGYPITPSTEIAEGCAKRLPEVGGRFIQMEDELASMAAVIGASVTGTKAMTATSGPGFSLKQENIGYAALAEIPCVIVDVQRQGPSTGLPTSPSQGDYMQARWGTHGDHPVIAVSPSSVQETYEETIRCFNLAERYRVPVILLMDEIVGHMREGIEMMSPEEITAIAYKALEDKKAKDVKILKTAEHTILADYFVICNGSSSTHIKALVDEVDRQLSEAGEPPIRREGLRSDIWVLMDFGSVIVHIFTDEARKFYDLERLWSDAEAVTPSSLPGP